MVIKSIPGATPLTLAAEILMKKEVYRASDVIVCQTYLNGACTKDGRYEGEPVHLQSMMNELFRAIRSNSKRCFLYLGGTASYFQLPPQWDDLVDKYVKQANQAGIPCVSGSAYDHLGIKREGGP